MKWTTFGCALPFALLWCGGTGVGVFLTVRTIVQHLDAQARFVAVEAIVESTEVVRSGRSGRKVRVTFSYEAGGSRRTAVGPHFDHVGASFADRDPSKYPAGLKTTAWVDPKRPDRAVLDRRIPQDTWWAMILFQPFLTISVGALLAMMRAPSESRRERDFLRKDGTYPWAVPDWGVLEEKGSVLTIHRSPAVAMAAGVAWGLSTFAGTFGTGMTSAAFGLELRVLVPPALALCTLVAAGFAVRSWRRGGRTVAIDRAARKVRIADVRGERTIPWSSIREVKETDDIVSSRNGPQGARLYLLLKNGSEETLHEFRGCNDDRAVAARIARHLADVLKLRT